MDGEIASVHSQIAGIRSEVSRVSSNVARIDGEIRDIKSVQRTITAHYKQIQKSVEEIKETLRLDREISSARDKRGDLRRELEEKFGQHKEIRRLAASLIRIVPAGFVDREILLDVAQRRMLDVADYWLSPATIAIAAWLSDDKERYARAIEYALTQEPGKTALMMTLLLRNHERGDAMRQWLAAYLSGLEPTNLPADFLVVIDGVASGVLGDHLAPNLTERMDRWYADATRSRDTRDDATAQWTRRLRSIAAGGSYAAEFPVLAGSCRAWETLRERHEVNTALEAAERHFRGRFAMGADVPLDLGEQMTGLLRKLADTPGADEERILRKIRELEAFIDTGDRAAAERRISGEEAGRTGSLNILSMVAGAAFPAGAGKRAVEAGGTGGTGGTGVTGASGSGAGGTGLPGGARQLPGGGGAVLPGGARVPGSGTRVPGSRGSSASDGGSAADGDGAESPGGGELPGGAELPAPTVTELLAIALSGKLIANAADSLESGTRCPDTIEIRVGQQRRRVCEFSCETEEETEPEALALQAEEETAALLAEIDAEMFQQQSKMVKFARRVFPSGLVASAAAAITPFAVNTGDPAWIFVLPASLVAVPCITGLALLPLRLRTLLTNGKKEKDVIARTVKEAAAELAKFFAQEKRARTRAAELRAYLRGLKSADVYGATRRVPSPPLPSSRDFPDWTPLPPDRQPSPPIVGLPELLNDSATTPPSLPRPA